MDGDFEPVVDEREEEDGEGAGKCALSGEDLEGYAEAARYYITGCAYDEPYDEGEVVWIHASSTIADILERVDVPYECLEQVAALLRCPTCGDCHDLYEDVRIKSDGEIRYEVLIEEWETKHSHRLDNFYEYLSKFPYLGAAHEVGSEIHASMGKFPVSTIADQIWFRARRIKSGKSLTSSDFPPPDPSQVVISEGRYNHHGQSAFYLANDKEGAAIECVDEGETLAWVQQFRLTHVENILDLTLEENWADDDWSVLVVGLLHSGALEHPVKRTVGWKPEYFIPRYIADCAREAGFSGILFKSTRHWADNLVLFSFDESVATAQGDPEIVQIKISSHTDVSDNLFHDLDLGPIPMPNQNGGPSSEREEPSIKQPGDETN